MSYREVFQVGAMLLVYGALVFSFSYWRIERRRAEGFREEVLVVRDLNRKLTKRLVDAEFARQYTESEREYWHRKAVNP
jgi:hypothetical protein